LAACLAVATACARPGGAADAAAGADPEQTYAARLLRHWAAEGARRSGPPLGTLGAVQPLADRSVDFALSDLPMTDEQLARVEGTILHVPVTLGAVALTYHLPGAALRPRFTPELLAAIALGQLTAWDDPRLAAVNPDGPLPALPIAPIRRSDESSTTAILSAYLDETSPTWRAAVGGGADAVRRPVGEEAAADADVERLVRATPGALGYVDLAYALQHGLPLALLQNAAGAFVEPTLDAVAAAASATLPEDLRARLFSAPDPHAWPLSSFSYVLFFADDPARPRAFAPVPFLWWAEYDGQKYARSLGHAPLPTPVVDRVYSLLDRLQPAPPSLLTSPPL
jgi:phosphate transport system substrate-binding protein